MCSHLIKYSDRFSNTVSALCAFDLPPTGDIIQYDTRGGRNQDIIGASLSEPTLASGTLQHVRCVCRWIIISLVMMLILHEY